MLTQLVPQAKTQLPPQLWEAASSSPEKVSDHELMMLLCAAPSRAEQNDLFTEFHRRFHLRVLAWCHRFTRDHARALDLTQEVFLRAWRHKSTFRADARPSTWLYVIARNHCLSAIQRLASDPLEAGTEIPARLPDRTVAHPDRQIEHTEKCRQMHALMSSTLAPIEARVMTLHYAYEVPLGALTRHFAFSNRSGAKAYIVNSQRKLKNAISRRRLPA
jgi:RNA polymerase sigma factor (sigma-70 family)